MVATDGSLLVYETSRPESADAKSSKAGSPKVFAGGCPKLMRWDFLETPKVAIACNSAAMFAPASQVIWTPPTLEKTAGLNSPESVNLK